VPGGRHDLQNRRLGTLCRGVGSIPTLSANSLTSDGSGRLQAIARLSPRLGTIPTLSAIRVAFGSLMARPCQRE
jgi:hypothetical protein